MNQGRELDKEDAGDPWFRPVWADEDEADAPFRARVPHKRSAADSPSALAGTDTFANLLEAAATALARLDAQAELLSPDLQEGLCTRLAWADAAGWLAAQGWPVHPLRLALRAAEQLGRHEFEGEGATAFESARWALDTALPRAAWLAGLLRRSSPVGVFQSASTAEHALSALGDDPTPFDPERFARWRSLHWPDGRRPDPRPALLRAAALAQAWMDSGVADQPQAAQALFAAHAALRQLGFLRGVPLPVWAGWPAVGAPAAPGALPRLRGDVAGRLSPNSPRGLPWPDVFLALLAEGARAGARQVASLRHAAARGAELASTEDRRSKLPAVLAALLRAPAVSAPSLARQLGITPQAALRLLERLRAAGLLREITGRKSFRIFALRLENYPSE